MEQETNPNAVMGELIGLFIQYGKLDGIQVQRVIYKINRNIIQRWIEEHQPTQK